MLALSMQRAISCCGKIHFGQVNQQTIKRQGKGDAMVEPMTPQAIMTTGQIGKIQELLGAGLRKAELQSEPVQEVLEHRGGKLAEELVAVVRKYAEAESNLIIRSAKVDRTRTPQQVLDATGRKQYTDRKAVDSMPRGEGEEVEVGFFKLDLSARGGLISDDDLEKEFEFRGIKPDPYAVAAVNAADPAFADTHPNGTHWKDAQGKWCFATFYRWVGGERNVHVC